MPRASSYIRSGLINVVRVVTTLTGSDKMLRLDFPFRHWDVSRDNESNGMDPPLSLLPANYALQSFDS